MKKSENIEYGLFTGAKLWDNLMPKQPVVDGILYERDLTVISAHPGVGKSILALQLACNLTTGTPFLDTYDIPRPMNVLYGQTEGDRAETMNRIKHISKAVKFDQDRFFHFNSPGLALNTDEGFQAFSDNIQRPGIKYDVMIIDPLYTTVKGTLSSDEVATDWFRNVRRIRFQHNCAILVLHHEGKEMVTQKGQKISKETTDVFGSTFWAAMFNVNYKLTFNKSAQVYTLATGKKRGGDEKSVGDIQIRMLQPSPLSYVINLDNLSSTSQMLEQIIRSNPRKMYRKAELQELIGKSKATIWRAVKELADAGLIEAIEEDGIGYVRWVS